MKATRYPTVSGSGLNPDPFLLAHRSEGPLRIQPQFGGECWLVADYDAVRMINTDARFSRQATVGVDIARTQAFVIRGASLLGMDPPDHTRIRRLVSREFTVRRIEELRPWVQGVTDDLLDAIQVAGPPADLVAGLALPLPITVISELLGVPQDQRAQFRAWADAFLGGEGTTAEMVLNAQSELTAFFDRLIETRRREPSNDLLGALTNAYDDDGDRLSHPELMGLASAILLAGFETTANQFGKFVYALLTHPEQLQHLRDDPALIPNAIEELLRFVPLSSGTSTAYVAVADVEIGGVTIRAGDAVMASAAGANRDPNVFADPDVIDVTRTLAPHLAFGHGAHYCLGAPLARMELQVALSSLLRRFPKLSLATPADEVVWRAGAAVWGLQSLPVNF